MNVCKKIIKLMCCVCFLLVSSSTEALELENNIQEKFNLTPEAFSYIEEAITHLENGSVNRTSIDWAALRQKVYVKAANANLPCETYEAIRLAILLLNDNHSFFLTPEQISFLENKNTDESIQFIQSHSKLINNEIGYLLIPSFSPLSLTAMQEYATNIQHEIRILDEHKLNKWIVDLRGNSGGNMWPMVLGLQSLIGSQVFGFFMNDSEEPISWNFDELSVKIGELEICSLEKPFYPLYHFNPWIAVLIDNQTASSGEATTVAFLGRDKTKVFGQKTGGYTSANEVIQLSDGAAIFLATTYLSDRLGRKYRNEITPDEIISEEGDAVLNSAIEWLQRDARS